MSAATGLSIGDRAPEREFGPMTLAMFVRYAGASGDFNPLHYDNDYARAAGYPSVFSQGMYQAALLATFVVDWLGPENIRRFAVRFREQVWPGDVLKFSGEIVASNYDLTRVQLTCTRQNGTVAMTGEADFRFG